CAAGTDDRRACDRCAPRAWLDQRRHHRRGRARLSRRVTGAPNMAASRRVADAVGIGRRRIRALYRRGGAPVRALTLLSGGPAAALGLAILYAVLVDDRTDAARLSRVAAGWPAAGRASSLARHSADGACRSDQRAVLRGGGFPCGLVALRSHRPASWQYTGL